MRYVRKQLYIPAHSFLPWKKGFLVNKLAGTLFIAVTSTKAITVQSSRLTITYRINYFLGRKVTYISHFTKRLLTNDKDDLRPPADGPNKTPRGRPPIFVRSMIKCVQSTNDTGGSYKMRSRVRLFPNAFPRVAP